MTEYSRVLAKMTGSTTVPVCQAVTRPYRVWLIIYVKHADGIRKQFLSPVSRGACPSRWSFAGAVFLPCLIILKVFEITLEVGYYLPFSLLESEPCPHRSSLSPQHFPPKFHSLWQDVIPDIGGYRHGFIQHVATHCPGTTCHDCPRTYALLVNQHGKDLNGVHKSIFKRKMEMFKEKRNQQCFVLLSVLQNRKLISKGENTLFWNAHVWPIISHFALWVIPPQPRIPCKQELLQWDQV